MGIGGQHCARNVRKKNERKNEAVQMGELSMKHSDLPSFGSRHVDIIEDAFEILQRCLELDKETQQTIRIKIDALSGSSENYRTSAFRKSSSTILNSYLSLVRRQSDKGRAILDKLEEKDRDDR